MDINSLLAPQDSPQVAPSSSNTTPKKPRKSRTTKPTGPTAASPSSKSSLPLPALAQSAPHQTSQQILSSPPISHPAPALRRAAEGTSDGVRSVRQGSTPGMDTLADLASMQHHQQTTRANAGGLRSTEIYESQGSANGPALPNLHASLPGRATLDHAMPDAPSQTAPTRNLATNALSETDSETMMELVTYLAANQFAYLSHIQLINLLHRGLRSHIQKYTSSTSGGRLPAYDLIAELRSAREAMNVRFAVGETLWIDWIEDEQFLATTFDECFAVMELCQKAVHEEPASTRLWSSYATWVTCLYAAATGDTAALEFVEHVVDIPEWSAEDKLVAAEVCSRQQLMDVWARGAKATKWRIDQSHTLWNTYAEFLLQDLKRSPNLDGQNALKAHFLDRLQTPHETWDRTFQMFSTFISDYENQSYEGIMTTVNQQCAGSKTAYGVREMSELAIMRAGEANSDALQFTKFTEYIEWERAQSRRKRAFVFELVDMLYRRVLLRFPATTEIWEGYLMFLNEEIVSHSRPEIDLLPSLDRATRHCPWSGSLWSQYLLAAERQRMPFPNIGQIKHKATNTGLLDAGGSEEVLQIYVAWCSILRRRAFQEESTDEELDVAEVGIRSAIEDMQRLGEAKYGIEYQGDPNYRLERIYIKYLTQSRNWHAARGSWKNLISSRGDSHEFWLRYYSWEMSTWGTISYSENATNAPSSPRPSEATKVLRTALKRPTLDWPERIIQVLQYHCEDHEDAAEIQASSVQIWKAKIAVKQRREKEAIEAYTATQAQPRQPIQSLNPEASADSAISFSSGKRKRDDDTKEPYDEAAKKPRNSEDHGSAEQAELLPTAPAELKRDRENATILVKNLPKDTSESRIRQYFRDCGTINSLVLAAEESTNTATATIEFESKEDSLTAQTKDLKDFDGRQIEVQVGSGCTVFLSNFPPTANEQWIREKFGLSGDIIDVRFPSLKYNTHRRFCYVQFKTADQARKATEFNGQVVGSNLKLVAKISNPGKRQDRTGALYEGREIYVRNLDHAVTERDLKAVFSKYGEVEKIRIPTNMSGRSKGFAFIAFSIKGEANAALEMNHTKLQSRVIGVEPATANGPAKRQATTVIRDDARSTASPPPDVHMTNGDHSTAPSPAPVENEQNKPSPTKIKARTVALLNVPDTVNDARILAIAEPYGPLAKVTLRPNHQGAVVEFKNVSDAGKAALGLDGYEITPGRFLGVGEVGEMMKQKAENKQDKLGNQAVKKPNAPVFPPSATSVRRPTQLGAKRGGRGGLPVISKGLVKKDKNEEGSQFSVPEGAGKSNADFKAMIADPKKDT
ncbi:MAG: hypothetical protein LQ352_003575 [Teloschistes flavicans]|nr:MAG: hypothetical protein LQ352_003575 [Teloschistes flavicans]